jgi:glycerol-3-phosphate O-acyltransferase
MLGIVADAHYDGWSPDLTLVPITISYDKIIEEEQHIRELLGEPKPKLSLRGLLTTGIDRVRSHNFGRISVQFGEEISLASYSTKLTLKKKAEGVSLNPLKSKEDRRLIVHELAWDIIHTFNREQILMSTCLVSAIVLAERRVVSKELLVARYVWLRNEVRSRKGRVDSVPGDAPGAVAHALRLLGDCLDLRRSIIEPAIIARRDYKNLLQLGLYSNALVPLFFSEGMCAVALASFGFERLVDPAGVSQNEAIPRICFLAELLSTEACADGPNTPEVAAAVLATMVQRRILQAKSENGDTLLRLTENGERIFNFMCSLYWPFVDSYWTTCFTLLSLRTAPKGLPEPLLVERVQWVAEKFYFDGILGNFQCCSRPTLASALGVFVARGVIAKQGKTITVAAAYQGNAFAKLDDLTRQIGIYKSIQEDARQRRDVYRTLHEDFPILGEGPPSKL